MFKQDEYEDILYEVDGTTAIVTINRPERYNAFRGRTVEELIIALRKAWADARVSLALTYPAVCGRQAHAALPSP